MAKTIRNLTRGIIGLFTVTGHSISLLQDWLQRNSPLSLSNSSDEQPISASDVFNRGNCLWHKSFTKIFGEFLTGRVTQFTRTNWSFNVVICNIFEGFGGLLLQFSDNDTVILTPAIF